MLNIFLFSFRHSEVVLIFFVAHLSQGVPDCIVEGTWTTHQNEGFIRWSWQTHLFEHCIVDSALETVPFTVIGIIVSCEGVVDLELLWGPLVELVNLILAEDVIFCLI